MTVAERVAAARAAERDGEWDAALAHYESAFASLSAGGGTAADVADLFRWIGSVHRLRGDADRAEEAYETSLAIAQCAGLHRKMASALNCLGIIVQFQGRSDQAESYYSQGRTYALTAGDQRVAAMIDLNLGTLASIRGNMQLAIASYESALTRFRAIDDMSSVISSLNNLGMAHRDLGDWPAAERCFDEAFELGNELRDALLIGNIELNRADLEVRRGRYDDARESCDRAFEVFTRVESLAGLGEAYKVYGALFGRMSKPSLADTHFARAAELAVESGDRLLEAEVSRRGCTESSGAHAQHGRAALPQRRIPSVQRARCTGSAARPRPSPRRTREHVPAGRCRMGGVHRREGPVHCRALQPRRRARLPPGGGLRHHGSRADVVPHGRIPSRCRQNSRAPQGPEQARQAHR